LQKKAFEENGWELNFRDIDNQSHQYLANQTTDIWNWLKQFKRNNLNQTNSNPLEN